MVVAEFSRCVEFDLSIIDWKLQSRAIDPLLFCGKATRSVKVAGSLSSTVSCSLPGRKIVQSSVSTFERVAFNSCSYNANEHCCRVTSVHSM